MVSSFYRSFVESGLVAQSSSMNGMVTKEARGIYALCDHLSDDKKACVKTLSQGFYPLYVGFFCSTISLLLIGFIGLAINDRALLCLYGADKLFDREAPKTEKTSRTGIISSWILGLTSYFSIAAIFVSNTFAWQYAVGLSLLCVTLQTFRFCLIANAFYSTLLSHAVLALICAHFMSATVVRMDYQPNFEWNEWSSFSFLTPVVNILPATLRMLAVSCSCCTCIAQPTGNQEAKIKQPQQSRMKVPATHVGMQCILVALALFMEHVTGLILLRPLETISKSQTNGVVPHTTNILVVFFLSVCVQIAFSVGPDNSGRWSWRETPFEATKFLLGVSTLVVFGPFVACQVVGCTLWEFIDKKTFNLIGNISWAVEKLNPITSRATKHSEDGYLSCLLLWLGVMLPGYFMYELHHAMEYGFDWRRVAVYNLFRIGPMYMNFMHVYVLCHKEGHLNGNLFKEPFKSYFGFKYAFNHWVGLFHGVVPGTFTVSHVHNHHRYDNDERDVYSTAFRPRDEFSAWVCYIPEWLAYAANISSIKSFMLESKWKFVLESVISTAFYLAFVAFIYWLHPLFCLTTIVYAFFEGNILLSVVNFTWHAFIEPSDPSNDYVNSTTIIEGLNFTGKEEYHVVHHQYPGVHRTRHEALYWKHEPEYRKSRATIFFRCNLFEVFGLCVSKNYGELADRYYYKNDKDIGMTRAEIAEMMRRRLQCYGPDIAAQCGRHATNKDD